MPLRLLPFRLYCRNHIAAINVRQDDCRLKRISTSQASRNLKGPSRVDRCFQCQRTNKLGRWALTISLSTSKTSKSFEDGGRQPTLRYTASTTRLPWGAAGDRCLTVPPQDRYLARSPVQFHFAAKALPMLLSRVTFRDFLLLMALLACTGCEPNIPKNTSTNSLERRRDSNGGQIEGRSQAIDHSHQR